MNTQNKRFQTFDPNPSLKYVTSLLLEAGITQYALIGKLAMWVNLDDESQHQYTKDVDFAILLGDVEKIENLVKKKQLNFKQLRIGGIGLRESSINVDFIDRRLHGVAPLFHEAIEHATEFVSVEQESIPVVALEYLVAMKIVSGEPKDDHDLKILLSLEKLNYGEAKEIVVKHLGPITGERLEVFARAANILPKHGPYRHSQ